MISGELIQSLTQISFCTERNCIIDDQVKRLNQNLHIINDFPAEEIKKYNTVFIYSHYVRDFFNKFFNHLNDNTVIVTHNSDECVDGRYIEYLNSSKIKKWFCQNRYITHEKLFSLPIGVANSQWPHGNMETIKKVSSKNNKKEFLVYKNYDIGTNINKRTVINNITNRNGIQMDRNRTFEEYLDTISKSLFVISPPGNGVDCHRIWECLSLKTIPVVEDHECFNQYKHLPILFIKDWNEVTIEFLRKNTEMINMFDNKINELDLNYWRQQLCME